MQDIRMRYEMSLTGPPQPPPQQQQPMPVHQSTNFGGNPSSPFSQQPQQFAQHRPMNLYTKTNHNGMILSTSNLIANQNTMNNNSNHARAKAGVTGGGGEVPSKIQSIGPTNGPSLVTKESPVGDMNSNHLIKLKAIANSFAPSSAISSEEDNSPTEMNNCRRMMDKPPLVKRLTMGLLMKTAEDSRPLVYNTHNHSPGLSQQLNNSHSYNNSSPATTTTATQPGGKGTANCDGYVNEGICDRERVITNKFGDSCRQSLMGIHQLDNNNQNQEFNFKKNLLRETSSGECTA